MVIGEQTYGEIYQDTLEQVNMGQNAIKASLIYILQGFRDEDQTMEVSYGPLKRRSLRSWCEASKSV